MHVEEYVNGKKRQMVKISGTEDEFDELGLEPHQKYKTKKGEQRVSVSPVSYTHLTLPTN